MWAPVDPAVARRTPISWTHAIRSWLLLLIVCTGLAAWWTVATKSPAANLLIGPVIAYVVVGSGLTGTMNHPRCRHWGWTFLLDLACLGFLAVLYCAGLAGLMSGAAELIGAVVAASIALAVLVILTNRPLPAPEPPTESPVPGM
jgi:hypothetical protein